MLVKPNPTSDKLLANDIGQVLSRYPGLVHRTGVQFPAILEGDFPIRDYEGVEIESVQLRLMYPARFPFAYPLVYETGGRFPKGRGDLHINGDGSLCLSTPQQERVDCYYGLDSLSFFSRVLVPSLSFRICLIRDIAFDKREFSHQMAGVLESYRELLCLEDTPKIVEFIRLFRANRLPERNLPCFCGSGRKYKVCHGPLELNLVKIGDDLLRSDLQKLETNTRMKL